MEEECTPLNKGSKNLAQHEFTALSSCRGESPHVQACVHCIDSATKLHQERNGAMPKKINDPALDNMKYDQQYSQNAFLFDYAQSNNV